MSRANQSGVGVHNVDSLIEKYGTQSEVARQFGCTRAHVSQAKRAADKKRAREAAAEMEKQTRELQEIGIEAQPYGDDFLGPHNIDRLLQTYGSHARLAEVYSVTRAYVLETQRIAEKRRTKRLPEDDPFIEELREMGVNVDDYLDSQDQSA